MLRVEDIEIIRAFREGDLGAFDEVVAEFREPLVRHAMRRLADVAAAEDAVQETFVRAYRSFDRLHEASKIGPWLHQILSNVCIDEAHRRRREAERTERVIADPMSRRTAPGAEQLLGLDHDTTSLTEALDTLPAGYQEALQMRFVDDLSYAEIAASSGLTEHNVRARVSRARSAVRLALRGVAVLPATLAAFMVRKAARTATVAEATATKAESGVQAAKFATHMAPAVEAATTVVVSAQASAPLISKAAVGIGAIALAAVSANPERSTVIPPAPAPIVAPTTVEVSPAPAPEAPPDAPERSLSIAAAPAPVEEDTPAVAAGTTNTPATADHTATTDDTGPEAATDPGATESEAETATRPEADATADADHADTPAAPPVVLAGGVARASVISMAEAGARTDLSGQLDLEVNGVVRSGAFTGRWAIDAEADRSGGHRLSGTVTVTIDGTPVELRLAGHARSSSDDPAGDVRTLSGFFRAANNAAAGLVEAGSFTGSVGPGTLVLRLTP